MIYRYKYAICSLPIAFKYHQYGVFGRSSQGRKRSQTRYIDLLVTNLDQSKSSIFRLLETPKSLPNDDRRVVALIKASNTVAVATYTSLLS
jgi:hypothetical protein